MLSTQQRDRSTRGTIPGMDPTSHDLNRNPRRERRAPIQLGRMDQDVGSVGWRVTSSATVPNDQAAQHQAREKVESQ